MLVLDLFVASLLVVRALYDQLLPLLASKSILSWQRRRSSWSRPSWVIMKLSSVTLTHGSSGGGAGWAGAGVVM
jgi:hypothetical protein